MKGKKTICSGLTIKPQERCFEITVDNAMKTSTQGSDSFKKQLESVIKGREQIGEHPLYYGKKSKENVFLILWAVPDCLSQKEDPN